MNGWTLLENELAGRLGDLLITVTVATMTEARMAALRLGDLAGEAGDLARTAESRKAPDKDQRGYLIRVVRNAAPIFVNMRGDPRGNRAAPDLALFARVNTPEDVREMMEQTIRDEETRRLAGQ